MRKLQIWGGEFVRGQADMRVANFDVGDGNLRVGENGKAGDRGEMAAAVAVTGEGGQSAQGRGMDENKAGAVPAALENAALAPDRDQEVGQMLRSAWRAGECGAGEA